MMIAKFCDKKHNPLLNSSTTIQVGSLNYYRTHYNDFIRDDEEGIISRNLNLASPQEFSGAELGKILGVSIAGNGRVSLSGNVVATRAPLPNAYLFCASMQDGKFPDYDSSYAITNADAFCQKLKAELRKQIVEASDIVVSHGQVLYLDNKKVESKELRSYVASHKNVSLDLFFLKRRKSNTNPPRIYESEKEYRFIFVPIDKDGKSIPFKQETLSVSSRSIKDLIS